MKKKSLVAMGLAGVMTIGMCVPVFADDTVSNESDPKTKTTTVEVVNPVVYSVTIPASITYSNNDGESKNITITVDKDTLKLEKNKSITITSDIVDNKLTLSNGKENADLDKVEVTINPPVDGSGLNDVTSSLDFVMQKPIFTNAGKYTGTIQFTVNYEDGTITN